MKSLLINLPLAGLLFAAAYWRDVQSLQHLATAIAWFIVMCGFIVVLWGFLANTEAVKAWAAKTYPGRFDRAFSVGVAAILAVGMATSGSPVLAAIYTICVMAIIALSRQGV